MKKVRLVLTLLFVAALAFGSISCGGEDADCNAGAKDECTSTFTTCVAACGLDGDQECADDCATDKCACLTDAGCDCD